MNITAPFEPDLAVCVRELAREAHESHGVPRDVAESAARATRSNLAELAGASLSRAERARAAAYFWSVVRRRAIRRGGARAYSRALVRASIERDLREAGWDAHSIGRELERSVS